MTDVQRFLTKGRAPVGLEELVVVGLGFELASIARGDSQAWEMGVVNVEFGAKARKRSSMKAESPRDRISTDVDQALDAGLAEATQEGVNREGFVTGCEYDFPAPGLEMGRTGRLESRGAGTIEDRCDLPGDGALASSGR